MDAHKKGVRSPTCVLLRGRYRQPPQVNARELEEPPRARGTGQSTVASRASHTHIHRRHRTHARTRYYALPAAAAGCLIYRSVILQDPLCFCVRWRRRKNKRRRRLISDWGGCCCCCCCCCCIATVIKVNFVFCGGEEWDVRVLEAWTRGLWSVLFGSPFLFRLVESKLDVWGCGLSVLSCARRFLRKSRVR